MQNMGPFGENSAAFVVLFLMFGFLIVGIPRVLILWFLDVFQDWPPRRWLRNAVVPLSWIVLLNGIWWNEVNPFYLGETGNQRFVHLAIILKIFIWLQLLGLGLLVAKAVKARRNGDRGDHALGVAAQNDWKHRRFRGALILLSSAVALNAIWIPITDLPYRIRVHGGIAYLIDIMTWVMLLGFGLLVASAMRTWRSAGPGKWFLVTVQTVLIAVSLFCWYQMVQDPHIFQLDR